MKMDKQVRKFFKGELGQETRDFSRGRNAPLAPFRDIICRCFQQH